MSNIDFPLAATNGQLFTASNGASYVYLTPPGLWRVSTSPTTAPFPPTGPASGDLVGTYPSPTIKPDVVLKGNPTLESVVPADDNDQSIATTAFVQAAIGLIPPPGGTTVGSTPPIIATPGQLWFNSNQGSLYVFYADPDSQQWVPATPSFAIGAGSVIDITMFGAVGDWTGSPSTSTDNTAAINAAISVAATSKTTKTIYIPAAAFGITGTLIGQPGVSIIGAGRDVSRICTATNNLTMLKLENISTQGLVFKGFNLEGVTGATGTTGLYIGSTLEQTGHTLLQDIRFINHKRGIDGGSNFALFDSRIEKCDFFGCSDWGELLAGSGVAHASCTYRVCGEGIRVFMLNGNSIGGGSFENSCLWVQNTYDFSLSGTSLRQIDVIGGWMEQTVTQHIHKITAGAVNYQSISFIDCLFQPAATATGTGIIDVDTFSGIISFTRCKAFNAPLAAAGFPDDTWSAVVSASGIYTRESCVQTNGAVVTPLKDAAVNVTGRTMTGPLAGTQANFSGALTVARTTDAGIGLRVAGLTKALTVTTSPTGTTLSGTDNTGVGSFQPLNLGGSVVNATVALTGTTATFNNTVTSTLAGQTSFRIDTAAGNSRGYSVYTSGQPRWTFGANSTAEGGSNVGSDFALNSYTDAGAFLAQPVLVTRSTSAVALVGALTTLSGTAVAAGAATQAFVKASSTANLGIYYGTGVPGFSAAKGSIYSCTNATTTTTRLYVNIDGAATWTNLTTAA